MDYETGPVRIPDDWERNANLETWRAETISGPVSPACPRCGGYLRVPTKALVGVGARIFGARCVGDCESYVEIGSRMRGADRVVVLPNARVPSPLRDLEGQTAWAVGQGGGR